MLFNWRFVDNGKIFEFMPGIGGICGMISVSMTGFRHFVKLGSGLKFGNSDVLDSYGLSVHKPINA